MNNIWLQFIIILATSYLGADCLKLIDANFFFENKISDDKEAAQLILDTINTVKQYDRSVVIFDIDSIAGVTKEFSSIKKDVSQATNSAVEDGEGSTYNFHKLRPMSMDAALKIGQNLKVQDNLWIIYITHEKMMTL